MCVFVKLDTILIFSKSETGHVHHVYSVLQMLLQNYWFVKSEKCEIHSSMAFFVLSEGEIKTLLSIGVHVVTKSLSRAFSRRLSLAERNYNICRELLAVKLIFEEWFQGELKTIIRP